jgi:hypothetical protein
MYNGIEQNQSYGVGSLIEEIANQIKHKIVVRVLN